MKNKKKYIILGFALIVLAGCTPYMDTATREVFPEKIIKLGGAWNWGTEGWFEALFVWPLAQLLNFFAQYVGAFLSITIVTLLIKLSTMKSTIKSQENQEKMALLKPDMDKIEKKYKGRDDQQSKMMKAQEMQKLYQKHDLKMSAGMGGMLLQLPVMIAMYQAVGRAQLIIDGNVLGQSFKDTPMFGIQTGNWIIIGLYVFMAVAQLASSYLPSYLAKQKQKNRPGQAPAGPNMQSMMIVSVGMVVFFALNWPLGMTVYWLISSVTQILQTLLIHYKFKK